jgi:MoaA/NifB/PqqE/SkfB family radical SAM enzyme
MNKLPEVVFLKLTSRCNQNCKYCYDSRVHPDINTSKLKKIFKLFHKNGAKAIVLTGGEPLIREDIPELLKNIKKYGLKIYLDTNGDFFSKYKKYIDKYVDILGLPIDYASEENYFRSSENFRNVLNILNYYKSNDGPSIRIGTVVTKENIDQLEKIAKLIKKYKIDLWKIYQFIPLGPNGFTNKEKLIVNNKLFIEKTSQIEKKYSKDIKIIISKRENRSKAYFFVSSDGTVFMPKDEEAYNGDIELGNIFDKDIISKWSNIVNMTNYNDNTNKTFHSK